MGQVGSGAPGMVCLPNFLLKKYVILSLSMSNVYESRISLVTLLPVIVGAEVEVRCLHGMEKEMKIRFL